MMLASALTWHTQPQNSSPAQLGKIEGTKSRQQKKLIGTQTAFMDVGFELEQNFLYSEFHFAWQHNQWTNCLLENLLGTRCIVSEFTIRNIN